jgi:hypothetical protein
MIAAVFNLEWSLACRRGRHFLFQRLYLAALLVEFGWFLVTWMLRLWWPPDRELSPSRMTGELATFYFFFFVIQNHVLLLLLTPALAAGRLTEEKSRGTLPLLLTTQLTTAQLLVGKWLGQASRVLVLTSTAYPLLAFLHVLAGLPPLTLLTVGVQTVLWTIVLAAGALLASVWAQRTTTAVLACYLGGAAALGMLAWVGPAVNLLDLAFLQPVRLVGAGEPSLAPLLGMWTLLLGLTAGCMLVAIWRLRPAHARMLAHVKRSGRGWWWSRPEIAGNPLRWKERFVGEMPLFKAVRHVPRWLGMSLVFLIGAGLWWLGPSNREIYFWHALALILVPGGLVSVRASGAISGERESQTWDSLLLTPLDTRHLVRGKLWGILDGAHFYLLAYLVPSMLWACAGGMFAVLVTIFAWLGAWLFLYFEAANGIYWSARADSSLRSLTRASSSGAWALFYRLVLLGAPCAIVVEAFGGFFGLFPWASQLMLFLGLVSLFTLPLLSLFGQAEFLLQQAAKCIAEKERGLDDLRRVTMENMEVSTAKSSSSRLIETAKSSAGI